MGKNLRMNIESSEVRTVMNVASEIQPNDIHRISFVEEDNVLFTTGTAGGASIVRPVAGLNDYSEIRAYIKQTIYATPISREQAKVIILNGGAASGEATKEGDKLSDMGIVVTRVGNAPSDINGRAKIYSMSGSGKKTATRDKLEEVYGVEAEDNEPPFQVDDKVDFVIILGQE